MDLAGVRERNREYYQNTHAGNSLGIKNLSLPIHSHILTCQTWGAEPQIDPH